MMTVDVNDPKPPSPKGTPTSPPRKNFKQTSSASSSPMKLLARTPLVNVGNAVAAAAAPGSETPPGVIKVGKKVYAACCSYSCRSHSVGRSHNEPEPERALRPIWEALEKCPRAWSALVKEGRATSRLNSIHIYSRDAVSPSSSFSSGRQKLMGIKRDPGHQNEYCARRAMRQCQTELSVSVPNSFRALSRPIGANNTAPLLVRSLRFNCKICRYAPTGMLITVHTFICGE